MRWLPSLLLAGVVIATPALAQRRTTVSFDVNGGLGYGGGGSLSEHMLFQVGAAMHLVVPRDRGSWIVGVVGEVATTQTGEKCSFSPGSSPCLEPFPEVVGLTAEAGIRSPAKWLAMDVTAGAGAFNVHHGNAALGLTGAISLATTGLSHLGLMASLRAVALPNTGKGALWYAPLSIGLRLR